MSLDARPTESWLVGAFAGAPESPYGTRFILGSILILTIGIYAFRHRVLPLPQIKFAGFVVLFLMLMFFSILWSSFPFLSLSTCASWLVCVLSLFAVVLVVGRKEGVTALLWALVLGGTLLAIKGIQEYGLYRVSEPSYRIFGDWNNPNALCGILAIIIPIGFSLLLSTNRLSALLAGLATSLMVFGAILTQSKGGLIATAIGSAVVIISGLAWGAKFRAFRSLAPIAVAGLFIFGVSVSTKSGTGAAFGTRLVASQSTQEQSVGFRTLLWKETIALIRAKPIGWGAGTFRFESARPGLTEQTFHAHQTWLQIAAEGGVQCLFVLLIVGAMWLKIFFSHAKKWTWPVSGLRAGIFGSILAAGVDGFFESNLVYLGIGIVVFMLLGAGLQLSFDGSTPEAMPQKFRWALGGLVIIIPGVILFSTAMNEQNKSRALQAMIQGDATLAKSEIASARFWGPNDGEAFYLTMRTDSSTPLEQESWLYRAKSMTPSTKFLRAYAKICASQNKTKLAIDALNQALEIDPNNMSALEQKYQILDSIGDRDGAISTARELVQVEDTPYYKVRAIPELITLETLDARLFLLNFETRADIKERYQFEALKGFAKYLNTTAPMIRKLTKQDPTGSFLGHDLAEVDAVTGKAKQLLTNLKAVAQSRNDGLLAKLLDETVSGLGLD